MKSILHTRPTGISRGQLSQVERAYPLWTTGCNGALTGSTELRLLPRDRFLLKAEFLAPIADHAAEHCDSREDARDWYILQGFAPLSSHLTPASFAVDGVSGHGKRMRPYEGSIPAYDLTHPLDASGISEVTTGVTGATMDVSL